MTEPLPSTRLLVNDPPIILGVEDVASLLTEILWYQQTSMALSKLVLEYDKLALSFAKGIQSAVQEAHLRVEEIGNAALWMQEGETDA